ncbi:MAG: acetyl-CoA carboxylase biotin carboxylase subunit [Chloroflexota bacterium]
MLEKILVANRGEIAKRIFAACRELSIPSVAVYSDADAGSEWIRHANEAYPLGGKTASESYLNIQKIIDIATACRADGIHPGYGFLSENAEFAEACLAADLTFIGPTPTAMRLMGSKASAREVAQKAGVPITPGIDGAGKTAAEMAAFADEIGYPVLIKASAGGGGKGMRVVNAPEQFEDAFVAAKGEAQNSFGNDHLILEKYFTQIHHIEIQILADGHGNVRHLFERECSIQRRHQKIIEESPSPTISNELRSRIAEAAVSLAQTASYTNAGTVEFMYTGGDNFYLLEMNTRLQVEHPITELVTGIDLPTWQIRIASGQPLSIAQSEIEQRGHAIECRLYAEDPANLFLPSIGKLTYVSFPQRPNLRVDAGIVTGEEVTPYYDPMLAKIITYGRSRQEAIERMVAALKETVIIGIKTNLPYLIDILSEAHFVQGETTTRYLDQHFASWTDQIAVEEDLDLQIGIAVFELLGGKKSRQPLGESNTAKTNYDPWQIARRWRNV